MGDIPCSGLTVIVGPNSSGKSQLLQDLYLRLCGEPRGLVVASKVRLNKPHEFDAFLKCLEAEGYLRKDKDPNNSQERLMPRTIFSGPEPPVPVLEPGRAQGLYQSYDPTQEIDSSRRNEFLGYFGKLLVIALFLDRRLTRLGQVGLIDFDNQPPQHDLHALHTNYAAREELNNETSNSFGKGVWTDMSRGTVLCLRVSQGDRPNADDRHSYVKMLEDRTIETEGDGLKSYVAICVALLLGNRPVCLIDEPEMCLHPPQPSIWADLSENMGLTMKGQPL